jgi:hypothetical protein
MSITKLRRFLITPMAKADLASPNFSLLRSAAFGGLCASLLFAAICGALGLKKAFRGEYVVQDDARQHVFWMQRFLEPELFPHDLIADYFQSVAPPGYPALYRLMARIGRHPLLFNKLLAAVLGPVTTAYCFGLCVQIFPIPATGFIAASQLNQNLWMTFDLVSATPRAFAYPLFLAFLYYLSRRSLLPCLAAIALQGLFYPRTAFISAGVLFLQPWKWEGSRPRLSGNRRDYLFCPTPMGRGGSSQRIRANSSWGCG